MDAMLDHPDARVLVWGPGYQGWVDENTIEQNMRSRFRCGEVDVHINFLGERERPLALLSPSTSSAIALWSGVSPAEKPLLGTNTDSNLPY